MDYDIFYFDGSDLSPEAEQRVQARADCVLADLDIAVELKNQARVHLCTKTSSVTRTRSYKTQRKALTASAFPQPALASTGRRQLRNLCAAWN